MTTMRPAPFGDYQLEIYLAGPERRAARLPDGLRRARGAGRARAAALRLSYVAGGAGDEHTQRANVAAFGRWGLIPRMLVGAASGTCRSTVRHAAAVPAVPRPDRRDRPLRPGRARRPRHRRGRGAARRADDRLHPLRRPDGGGRRRLGETPGFFQLYTPTDRELAESLVRRAEAAGFRGIVVTLDTWITGWRPRDLATSNFPQLRGHCLANYFSDPVFRSRLAQAPPRTHGRAVRTGPAALRQPADLGRPALAALADHAAADPQGHLPSRRRAPRPRRGRRRHLLLQPRRPAGQRRPARARLPARRGRGRGRDARAVRLRRPLRRRHHQGPRPRRDGGRHRPSVRLRARARRRRRASCTCCAACSPRPT